MVLKLTAEKKNLESYLLLSTIRDLGEVGGRQVSPAVLGGILDLWQLRLLSTNCSEDRSPMRELCVDDPGD
jgi:hypothetical protein